MCKTVSVRAGQEHPDPPRASPDGLESRLAVAFRPEATSSAEPVEACVRTRGPGGQGAARVQVQAQGGGPSPKPAGLAGQCEDRPRCQHTPFSVFITEAGRRRRGRPQLVETWPGSSPPSKLSGPETGN